jgi:hypothetical protein
MKVVIVMFLTFALTSVASADTVRTYAGNVKDGYSFNGAFPGCGCALNGTLTLAATSNPLAWNFTDGARTSNMEFLYGKLADRSNYVDQSVVGKTGFGYEAGSTGVQTSPVGTAEPATGILVGLSLAIAGLIRRKKKKPLDSAQWENLG